MKRIAPKDIMIFAAVVEAGTGLVLMAYPQALANLLLGADLVGAGVSMGRVAGAALLSLGLCCWMSRRDINNVAILASMFAYNLLVAGYLAYLGFRGETVGLFLWPAMVLHAVLAVLFGRATLDDRQAR